MPTPNEVNLADDFQNKLETLIGLLDYLHKDARRASYPTVKEVIEEANEWLATKPFHSYGKKCAEKAIQCGGGTCHCIGVANYLASVAVAECLAVMVEANIKSFALGHADGIEAKQLLRDAVESVRLVAAKYDGEV